MYYNSTRNSNLKLSGYEAVVKGLSDDGGLFVNSSDPEPLDLDALKGMSYQALASVILGRFFDHPEELEAAVNGAYDSKFDSEEIVPLTPFHDGYLMELWHGPTSAFKDVALTILPRLLTSAYKLENRSDTVAILTATSGDTGKAALSGFADVPNTAITVFYPVDGVSPVQKRQMATSKGSNVQVIAVEGNFDDCQRMVKEACSSERVKAACHNVTISSANSINIGRLVPQIVYYVSSYLKLVEAGTIAIGDEVSFVVPTGNFGDILAGYLAKKLGLPVKKLIVASNSNNVLTDFLNTGTYSVNRPFHLTMSPSMDILISSNLERLLYFESGRDEEKLNGWMKDLKETGEYTVDKDIMDRIRSVFEAYWCDENACRKEIHDLYQNEHLLIDPHTAIAVNALHQYQANGNTEPCIVLSTASPFKFCRNVLSCISDEDIADDFEAMDRLAELTGLTVPKGLAELKDLPVRFTEVIKNSNGIERIAKRMEELSHD